MPYRTIPTTDTRYFMIVTDKNGAEQDNDPDAPNGKLSELMLSSLVENGITDVFIRCHGWHQDKAKAFAQFDSWIGAFASLDEDRRHMQQQIPSFQEMHIGFHWPSLAWGDEKEASDTSFSPANTQTLRERIDFHIEELGGTPEVRAALYKIFDEVRTDSASMTLSDTLRAAYLELNAALDLGANGAPGEGSADRLPFDPDQTVAEAVNNVAFGNDVGDNPLLAPLRQLTFWTMKKRAKDVGERGLHPLLRAMQQASPAVRIHLMGHSFGCIVASAAIAGPSGAAPLPFPINSCVLVQGAMSIWSFTSSLPSSHETAGFFNNILVDKKISGPFVATRSDSDMAVGKLYPWAAGVAGQVAYMFPPLYAAIGALGICGIPTVHNITLLSGAGAYAFVPAHIYNVNSSNFICHGDGISGSHSDIAGPEVAHLLWQAALKTADAS